MEKVLDDMSPGTPEALDSKVRRGMMLIARMITVQCSWPSLIV